MTAHDRDTAPALWLFLGLLALIPLIGAVFGTGNQTEQLSIVARLLDPAFAPGDFYVDSAMAFGPRVYYAQVLAALGAVLPMPLVIHGLSVLCNVILGAVSYGAARHVLGAGLWGGLVAAVLAVTNGGFSLGLSGYLRFDSFQPASLATALSLLGVYGLLRGRAYLALLAFCAAAPMHPLMGVEIPLLAYGGIGLAALVLPSEVPLVRRLAPLVTSALLFVVFVALVWGLPVWGLDTPRMDAATFFDTLVRLRAPHHYLGLEFPARAWLSAGLFTGAAALAFGLHARGQGLTRGSLGLALAALVVVALCLASLYFVDIAESRLWVTAQPFRLLALVKWAGFVWLAWLFGRDDPVFVALAVPVVLVTGDAQPIVIVLALVTCGGILAGRRLLGGRLWDMATWAGIALLWAVSALLFWRFGVMLESARAALALALALVLFAAPWQGRGVLAAAVVLGALGLTAVTREDGLLGQSAFQADYVWSDLKSDPMDVARAAAEVSPPDALWVVPPFFESFRLLSRRALVVDFESIPFEDAAMVTWRERLTALYGDPGRGGFAALDAMIATHRAGTGWMAVARDLGATHAVIFADTPWDGPVLYANDSYKAVPLDP